MFQASTDKSTLLAIQFSENKRSFANVSQTDCYNCQSRVWVAKPKCSKQQQCPPSHSLLGDSVKQDIQLFNLTDTIIKNNTNNADKSTLYRPYNFLKTKDDLLMSVSLK